MAEDNWNGVIEVDLKNVDFSHPAFIAEGYDCDISGGPTYNTCLSCDQPKEETLWFRCEAMDLGQLCMKCVLEHPGMMDNNLDCGHSFFDTYPRQDRNIGHTHIHKVDMQLTFLKALIRSGTPFKLDGDQYYVTKEENNIKG